MRNFKVPIIPPNTPYTAQNALSKLARTLVQPLIIATNISLATASEVIGPNAFGQAFTVSIGSGQKVTGIIESVLFNSSAATPIGTIPTVPFEVMLFDQTPLPTVSVGDTDIIPAFTKKRVADLTFSRFDWETITVSAAWGKTQPQEHFITDSTGFLHGVYRHLGAITLNNLSTHNQEINVSFVMRLID